jgi:hypothetical protein
MLMEGFFMAPTPKDLAHHFLEELEKVLNLKLPSPAKMEPWIRATVQRAKANERERHLRLPEAAFLNGWVLPTLFELLKTHGLPTASSRQALLNEYHRCMPDISCRSPIRWEKHPFGKSVQFVPSEIYRGWMNPEKGHALTQSAPDFSLSDPFPHSILFEGKYFRGGSLEYAQRQLVTNIYEASFYRGLPSLRATKKHREWKYDYACFMAYDSSKNGTLASAWTALPLRTRRSFWESANIYVMILRGGEAA